MGIGQRFLLFYMMVHIETSFDIFSKKKNTTPALKEKKKKKKAYTSLKNTAPTPQVPSLPYYSSKH